jgi:hypothetical protein
MEKRFYPVNDESNLLAAVAAQVAEMARVERRTAKDVLLEMKRHLEKERLRRFVSRNRADARRDGIKESDVERLIKESRNERNR